MSLTRSELDSYIKGELEIHFRIIEVIQNSDNSPRRYSGPGTVTIKNGRLEYILHHALTDEANDRALLQGFEGKAGQVIRADQSFRFTGTDVHGRVWETSETDTYRGVVGQNGTVVKGDLQCLRTYKKPAPIRIHSAHYILAPNSYFPKLDFMPESGVEFVVDGKTVSAHLNEYGCDISITGSGITEVSSDAVLKIFEIVTGTIFQIRAVEFNCSSARWTELRSINSAMPNVQLPPPIELSEIRPWASLEEFFSSFYNFFLAEGEKIYDYWYQLNRAWQGGLQAASLTICIYVEGVLREYFEPLGRDRDFNEMAKKSLPEVLDLKIPERVIELLRGSIGNAGQFKAKTALHHLAESKAISEGLASYWTKLRHDSAHGVRAGEGYQAQQRQVDLTFNNLKLFYEIIFHLGGYEGARIDYGTHGFPNKLGKTAQ